MVVHGIYTSIEVYTGVVYTHLLPTWRTDAGGGHVIHTDAARALRVLTRSRGVIINYREEGGRGK